MKKSILSIFTILLSASFCIAQVTPPANPDAAEISFDTVVHNFGTIQQGGNGTWDFKFSNSGKTPLIISKAKGSCGCTVPSWPKEPIKAGETSTIRVTYDTKRIGSFTKTVTITSNAKTASKVITIKGKVEPAPEEETFPGKIDHGLSPLENQN